MKDLLIQTLEPLGYPIKQQGSIKKEEPYPESFFTFWNNDTSGDEFYDNETHSYIWNFDLMFYSTDPDLVNAIFTKAKPYLKANGFITVGKGYDVASDEPSHTGRGINVLKLEK